MKARLVSESLSEKTYDHSGTLRLPNSAKNGMEFVHEIAEMANVTIRIINVRKFSLRYEIEYVITGTASQAQHFKDIVDESLKNN